MFYKAHETDDLVKGSRGVQDGVGGPGTKSRVEKEFRKEL